MKILIIQTAFIGDVILATPLIEKIKKHYSESKIDFLLRSGNEGLLENHPHLRQILIWNKKKNKYRNLFSLLKRIRNEEYDYIINAHRFLSSGILTAFSKAHQKIGFVKNPLSFLFTHSIAHRFGDNTHEIERNLSLIAHFTDDKKQVPVIYPGEQDFHGVKKWKQNPYITIAPASVWFTKQFPAKKWIEFLGQLDAQYAVYFIGSAQDKNMAEEIIHESGRKKMENLCGELTFLQSAALMKDAEMNYVNDSAPMHIASAVNAKTTAVFCSTIPEFGFGPLAGTSRVIQVEHQLKCRPCNNHGKKSCPEKHFKCALDINVKTMNF